MCVREEGLWWVVGPVILQELLGTPERTLLSPQPPEEHSRLKDPRMRVLSELETEFLGLELRKEGIGRASCGQNGCWPKCKTD